MEAEDRLEGRIYDKLYHPPENKQIVKLYIYLHLANIQTSEFVGLWNQTELHLFLYIGCRLFTWRNWEGIGCLVPITGKTTPGLVTRNQSIHSVIHLYEHKLVQKLERMEHNTQIFEVELVE